MKTRHNIFIVYRHYLCAFANSIILSKIIFPKYGWNLKDEDDPTGELTEEVTEAMTEEVNEEDTVSDSMKEG